MKAEGIAIVVRRTLAGTPRALRDTRPHQAALLSTGRSRRRSPEAPSSATSSAKNVWCRGVRGTATSSTSRGAMPRRPARTSGVSRHGRVRHRDGGRVSGRVVHGCARGSRGGVLARRTERRCSSSVRVNVSSIGLESPSPARRSRLGVRCRWWRLGESGSPMCTFVGTPLRGGPQAAALANGTASHVHDYDDISFWMQGHPTVTVGSAVLALAELRGLTGEEVIAALAAGYEIGSRVGIAIGKGHYLAGWHSTGTIGTFASAAGASRALGLDAEATERALGLPRRRRRGSRSRSARWRRRCTAGRRRRPVCWRRSWLRVASR